MHPELLRTLAKARHDDLLNTHPARGQPKFRLIEHLPRFSGSRRWLGSLFIRAGARLTGERPGVLEPAHE